MRIGQVLRAARKLRVQFALIVALAMAPAGLVAIIQAASNIEKAVEFEEQELRKIARQVSEEERTAVLSIRELMRLTARTPSIRALGGEECTAALERLVRNDPRFSGGLVFDPTGKSVCGPRKGFDISSTAAFQSFIEAPRILVGPVRIGRISGRNMMLTLAPVLSEDGRTGILALGLAADFFEGLTADSATDGIRFALLDEAGAVFAENESGTRDWLPENVAPLLEDDEVFATREARDGVSRSYFVAPMPIDRFWMIAARPEPTWAAILLTESGFELVTPLLLWAIAVGVAFFVIDRLVSRHIVYLQRVATAIGRGHLEIGKLRLDGAPFEIKRLGDALETMSDRLAEREASLRANIEAKRALLLEVHHRVKNNLQMISSLMNMQLRRAPGTAEQRSMQIVQDRIHGLALVHQHLYSADRLDAVALDRLVEDLATYLRGSLCPPGAEASLEFDLAPIEASADIATPVALFLTEAVSNAFKHCWRPGSHGELRITLTQSGDEEIFELTVRNDRMAQQGQDDIEPCSEDWGLGTRLMHGFAQQIGGSLRHDVTRDRYQVTLVAPSKARGRTFALRHRDRPAPVRPEDYADDGSDPPAPTFATQ